MEAERLRPGTNLTPIVGTIRLETYVPTQPDEYPIGYVIQANLHHSTEEPGWWEWEIVCYNLPHAGMAPSDPNGELYDFGFPEATFIGAIRAIARSWAGRAGSMDDPMGDGPEPRR